MDVPLLSWMGQLFIVSLLMVTSNDQDWWVLLQKSRQDERDSLGFCHYLHSLEHPPSAATRVHACQPPHPPTDRLVHSYKANTVRFRRPLKGLESQYVTLLRSRNFWCSHKNQLHGHWLSLYIWSHHSPFNYGSNLGAILKFFLPA